MNFKDQVEVVSHFVTMVAIVTGGIWTYKIFVEERQEYPHVNVELKAGHVSLDNCLNLIRVAVELTNSGASRVVSGKAIVRVQQVRPLPPCYSDVEPCASREIAAAVDDAPRVHDRFSWLMLASRKQVKPNILDLEPGEKQEQDYEFVVASDVEVVRIYSYYQNDSRTTPGEEIGWTASKYYELQPTQKEKAQCKGT